MDELNEIISFLNDHGVPATQITPDGQVHKVKLDARDSKMSGWYKAYQNHTVQSGEVFYVVLGGNFREGTSFKYQSDNVTTTKEDRTVMKEQIKKAKADEAKLRLEKQNEVAEEMLTIFDNLNSEGYSAYFTRKNIAKCKGMNVLFDNSGNVFIPLQDINGKFWSLQKITEKGSKRYKSGGRIADCFNIIGDIDDCDTLYLTEGFATGASIRMATNDTVIVTFTADNLIKISRLLRKQYPDKAIVICGDDDKFKVNKLTKKVDNVGRTKAIEAEKASLGKAIFPIFKDESSKPTDFNDLHSLEGIKEVKKQLSVVEKPKLALYALGFKEKEYFFTSSENRQMVGVTAFSEKDFLDLMPLEYWEAMYPGHTDSIRVDWTTAKSFLMAKCRSRGLFDGFNVRGAGVWIDEGRIIVNMGDHLIVDGRIFQLGNIRSKYFYTLGKKLKDIKNNPLETHECQILLDALQKFVWKKSDSNILLAGALVLSRICGALPYRPHVWITGGAETGKTTLMEKLIKPIVGDACLYVQRGTSEAGIRQTLKSNSIPVLFDEFEISGNKSDEHIHSLLELMRGSWSDSNAQIVKGGATGNASIYKARFSAIVSSIRTKLTETADKGRFTVLELAPHGDSSENWKNLSEKLTAIDSNFSERLFARTIKLLPVILENFKVMKVSLAKAGGARFSDQYGMILSAYATLIHVDPITQEEGDWLVDQVDLDDAKEISNEADHDMALSHLMSTKLTYMGHMDRQENLVGELIIKALNSKGRGYDEDIKNALNMIGIRVSFTSVAIASPNHAEMQNKVWRNTKWSESWGILSRINNATRKKMRLPGMKNPKWCITIPRENFITEQ